MLEKRASRRSRKGIAADLFFLMQRTTAYVNRYFGEPRFHRDCEVSRRFDFQSKLSFVS